MQYYTLYLPFFIYYFCFKILISVAYILLHIY